VRPPEAPPEETEPPRIPRGPFIAAVSVLALLTVTFAVIAHYARQPAAPPAKTAAP
jgi:hypothetical protein